MIFRFLKIHKKIVCYPNRNFFFAEVNCVKYKIRWKNKPFEVTGALTTETKAKMNKN